MVRAKTIICINLPFVCKKISYCFAWTCHAMSIHVAWYVCTLLFVAGDIQAPIKRKTNRKLDLSPPWRVPADVDRVIVCLRFQLTFSSVALIQLRLLLGVMMTISTRPLCGMNINSYERDTKLSRNGGKTNRLCLDRRHHRGEYGWETESAEVAGSIIKYSLDDVRLSTRMKSLPAMIFYLSLLLVRASMWL